MTVRAGKILMMMVSFSLRHTHHTYSIHAHHIAPSQPPLSTHSCYSSRRGVIGRRGGSSQLLLMEWSSVSRCLLLPVPTRGAVPPPIFHPNSYCALLEEGRDGRRGEVARLAGRGQGKREESTSSLANNLDMRSYQR